jgi:hypothetical protein
MYVLVCECAGKLFYIDSQSIVVPLPNNVILEFFGHLSVPAQHMTATNKKRKAAAIILEDNKQQQDVIDSSNGTVNIMRIHYTYICFECVHFVIQYNR